MYLSRYTHRTAISNEQIRLINGSQVVFTVRGDGKGDKPGAKRMVRLDGPEFVRHFMLHILPKGSKRIRHYGVLASSCKAVKLAAARAALQMPAPNPQAMECAQAFMARVARPIEAKTVAPNNTRAKSQVIICACPRSPSLQTPYAADQHLFGAAVQSNKVYSPRLRSSPTTGIAARRINAIR